MAIDPKTTAVVLIEYQQRWRSSGHIVAGQGYFLGRCRDFVPQMCQRDAICPVSFQATSEDGLLRGQRPDGDTPQDTTLRRLEQPCGGWSYAAARPIVL
jgi:hypothetical protein